MIHGIHGPRLERWAFSRATAFARLFRRFHSHDRGCRPGPPSPCTPRKNLRTSPEGSFTRREIVLLVEQLAEPPRNAPLRHARPGYSSSVVKMVAGQWLELQRIAGRMSRALPGNKPLRPLQSHGMQDVALLAVALVQQRQVRAAIRVVSIAAFRGHAKLVRGSPPCGGPSCGRLHGARSRFHRDWCPAGVASRSSSAFSGSCLVMCSCPRR